jgi:hypothetical protein
MGASIFPVSGYRGSQYDISLLVWKVDEYNLRNMYIDLPAFVF